MNEALLLVIAALLLAWSVLSGALARHNLTGRLLFLIAGFGVANPDWGPVPVDLEATDVHTVAEITLALVLFSDASRIDLSAFGRDLATPARLLAVGLPLTLILGGWAALLLFGDLPWSLALFIGAALAPTDAALSVQVINDERVPMRLRQALNVESGLNDGIATPIVTLALAVAISQLGLTAEGEAYEAGAALRELGMGAAAGGIVGLLGAAGINRSAAGDLSLSGGHRLAALATALAAFGAAVALDANGFIAAFVAGVAFGAVLDTAQVDAEETVELPELGGELLALLVWFVFGAGLVPLALEALGPSALAYALLSLTIFRMVPVAVSMAGARISLRDVVFLGWFGPRGLASVVFAVLAIEGLGEGGPQQTAVGVVAMTVLLSVVLHGVTAGPVADRYGRAGSDGVDASVPGTGPRPRASRVVSE